jgi:outer membrane protein
MKLNSTYRRIWSLAAGVLLILQYTGSQAQDKRPLSLKDAISLSIQNSKEIKLSKAKIDAALASIKTANNNQLPNVDIQGQYLWINHPNINLKSGGDSSGTSNSGLGSNVNSAGFVMASVSEPIFNGFIIQSQKASAKYLAEAAKLDAEKDQEDVILNVINAYSNLYKAQRTVSLVQDNLDQQVQRVKDFTNLEKNGLVARNDLLKVQLQQSNVEVSLLEAQSNMKVASITLDLLIGLPESTLLEADTTTFEQAPSADAKAVEQWEQVAMQNRKDAAALEARSKAADADIKAAKGAYYPSLAATAGYVGIFVPNLVTVPNAFNAGIAVKYSPSSFWKNGSKVEQAKVQAQQIQLNEQQLQDNIHLSVSRAYEDYLVSTKKIDMYQKAIEQAEENYKIVKNKQENNLATTTDLLEADVANVQAKLNEAFAKADAVVSYKKLLEAAGVLNETGTPATTGK